MVANKEINTIIADDSKTFLEGLHFMLSKSKRFNVIDKCSNGKELIESDQLINADLILTDIEMPEKNGLEAARLINFSHPSLPIIAMTMHVEKVFLTEIIETGFRGFLYKPDIPKELFNVIDSVFKKKLSFPQKLKIK